MAAPGGGRPLSEAWLWFNEKAANDEVSALKANIGIMPTVADPVKEVYQGLPDVSGGVLCFGCTGYIGEAVIFDAVRRGLTVTVFIRQQSVERFTATLKELKIQDKVTLYAGDLTNQADVEKSMQDTKAECCISLLASPQVTDEQNIYDVDYTMSHNVVQAARKCGIKQLIYCSDTGVYQPALATQFHKLRIEGELMRSTDNLQWTIVRPTTYHPYVVTAIVLDEVRQGSAVNLFGSADDVGDLAVYNPIAREDLGRFIVSCVLNQNTYGRVLAVGGPWSADNVTTLGDNAKLMIELASPVGKKPSTIKPLGLNLADIIYKAMEALGHFSPMLKKVATIVFYYTKYWSTVSHFSAGTGVYDTKTYTKELVDAMKKDPDAFAKFVANAKKGTTGSIIYPTPLNSWWDITQPSVLPAQLPMGAGDPHGVPSEPRVLPDKDEMKAKRAADEAAAMCMLRSMAPGAAMSLGQVPKQHKDASLYRFSTDLDSEWVLEE